MVLITRVGKGQIEIMLDGPSQIYTWYSEVPSQLNRGNAREIICIRGAILC
jgi:hypothetical protein